MWNWSIVSSITDVDTVPTKFELSEWETQTKDVPVEMKAWNRLMGIAEQAVQARTVEEYENVSFCGQIMRQCRAIMRFVRKELLSLWHRLL